MCNNQEEDFSLDCNGCFNCETVTKVKARFGLAWVSESPDCPCPEPVGWQVEFVDTPSKVEQKCEEMVRWINCPPLPKCQPCPPDELCCCSNMKRTCCCRKPEPPCCSCQKKKPPKRCSCEKKRCCTCGRCKSPPKRCCQ